MTGEGTRLELWQSSSKVVDTRPSRTAFHCPPVRNSTAADTPSTPRFVVRFALVLHLLSLDLVDSYAP